LRAAQVRGLLRVRLHGFVVPMVLARLPGFLAHFPSVDLHIEIADEASDRPSELADCIIRSGRSLATDTDLGMRRIAPLEWTTCPSPRLFKAAWYPGIARRPRRPTHGWTCLVADRQGPFPGVQPGRSASPCRAAVPDDGRQLRPDGRVGTPPPRADPGAAPSPGGGTRRRRARRGLA